MRRCWYRSAASALFAGDTRTWSQSEYADFQQGIARNLSLGSDGLVTLAPRLHELYDTSLPYLWAVARDSKGNLYAGGGTGAKLFRIPPDGKGKLLAEFETLAVQAVAVDSQGPRLRRHFARWQGVPHRRQRQSRSLLRSQEPSISGRWPSTRPAICYVATGDQGEIFRVPPDGKGKLFFKTDEDPRALHGLRCQRTT